MASLSEIRAQYPQYSDLNDKQLMDGLHRKFYSDMPREEFDKRLGVSSMSTADVVADVGEQAVRGVNRGLNSVLSLPGQIIGGAVNMVAPGQGERFKFNNPLSEFLSSPQAKPQSEAGRYADSIGQAVGASAIPMAGLYAKAAQPVQAAATSTLGQIGQQVVQGVRANPGGALAADAVASVGSGAGQQAAEEAGFGPTGKMIGGLAGAFAPTAAVGAARSVVQPIRRAYANQGRAGAYGSIADDLPAGVDAFADQVATGAGRGSAAVNQRTLTILGEEMERAGGDVAAAQAATINRISQEFNVTPQTARSNIRALTSVHEDSQLMLGEYPAVAGSDATQRMRQAGNVNLDDLGRAEQSTTQATLDYLANNGNAQSAQNVRNAVGRRQEDLAPAMRQTLEGIGPQVGNRAASIVDSEQMIDTARQSGSAAYQAAYRGPINTGEIVHRLPRLLDAALNYAAGRSGEIAGALRRAVDQFYIQTPQGQRLAMGTLQQLQDARGVVRGQITEYTRAGRADLVRAVQPFYDRITQVMERASPQWGVVNRQWADMNFLRIAEDLGDAFATKAGPLYRQQIREFNNLAPQAQDIVRIHFLQKLYDKLDNLPDTASVSKLFANDQSRAMVRELFGDQAAIALVRATRDQKVAEGSGRMLANSATHRRGMTQKQKDVETGLVAAVQNASVQGARNWLLERATQILTERRNRPMADILTTPMSDTARVAQHLHNMRAQQQRLRQFAPGPALPQPSAGAYAPIQNALTEDGRR